MGSTKLKRQQMRIHDEAMKKHKQEHVSKKGFEGVQDQKGRKGRKHGTTQYEKKSDLEFTGGNQ